MSTYTLPVTAQEYFVESLFSLHILQKTSSTKITMQSFGEHVHTGHIPFIDEVLREHLPSVLLTQCYNDEELPFAQEVKDTEIGHLFEHILLEYLCQLKIAKGSSQAVFSGRTSWNWIKDPKGKFHINLTCGVKDSDILPIALEKTIKLMKIVLSSEQEQFFSTMKVRMPRNGLKNGKKVTKKTT